MKNLYKTCGDITIIYLNRKKTGEVLECLIDTEDFEMVASYEGAWAPQNNNHRDEFYAKNYHGQFIHRLVIDAPKGLVVDHINHNSLDNRKSNLRAVSLAVNSQNRKGATRVSKSGIRGVAWDSKQDKWRAYIWLDKRNKYLGWYDNKYEAGRVATKARLEHFGSLGVDRTPIRL